LCAGIAHRTESAKGARNRTRPCLPAGPPRTCRTAENENIGIVAALTHSEPGLSFLAQLRELGIKTPGNGAEHLVESEIPH